MYGCPIYDNGWIGTDRGHGHAIYTQNNDGTKIISDCILAGGCGYTMHSYTQEGQVNNYVFEGNIAYDNPYHFLTGSGKGCTGSAVKNNYLHNAGELMVKAATDCKVARQYRRQRRPTDQEVQHSGRRGKPGVSERRSATGRRNGCLPAQQVRYSARQPGDLQLGEETRSDG